MARADFKKHYNRGRQLAQKGHFHEAIEAYETALTLKPADVGTVFQLGNVSKAMHLYDVAIKWYDVAMSMAPSKAEIAFNRATALAAAGRNEDALRAYQVLGNQMAHDAMFWNSLGTLYLQMGLLPNAIEALEKAVAIKPGYAEAWHNLAIGYFDSRHHADHGEKWEKAFQKAERQLRGDPEFHVTRATSRFAAGDYGRGWDDYAYRHKPSRSLSVIYDHAIPWWKGESLHGRTILIGEEQGIGDQITFLSALPDLIEQAKHVILEVNAKLAPTLARNYPNISVITADAETRGLKRFHRYKGLPQEPDFFAPLGDMFHILRPTLTTFEDDAVHRDHFVTAEPIHYKKWSDYLSSVNDKKKVGLSWRSQKTTGARNAYYMDFQILVPWMERYPDIQFVNLQYGDCSEELDYLERASDIEGLLLTIPDLDLFDDIEGTLGLIASLDLVFSVRNSQASFAGALGIQTLAYYQSFFQFGRKYTDPIFKNTLAVHPQDGDEAVLKQLDMALTDFESAYHAYKQLDHTL